MNKAVERAGATLNAGWLAAGWFGFAILDASRTVLGMYASGMHHDWLNLFLLYFLAWLPWWAATPAILRMAQRSWRGRSWRTWAVAALGLAGIFTASSLWFACIDTLLEPWLEPGPPAPFLAKLGQALYGWTLPALIVYALIVALGLWLHSRATLAAHKLETARLSEQLALAELSALRQQIEPHFLFNTLNGIVGLMREQRIEPAIGAIVDLSELLRGTLQRSHRSHVTLLEELELLGRYLEIQKTRFGARLTVQIDVPAVLYSLLVPAPLLQPLVENAIRHGIEQRERGGRVRIRAERCGEVLHVRVDNDGPSLAQAHGRTGSGIGLGNLRKRLSILYEGRFSLELRDREGGVEAAVSFPIAGIAAGGLAAGADR